MTEFTNERFLNQYIITPTHICEKVEKENPPPYVSALDNLNFFSNEISWEIMSTEIELLTNSNEFTRLHPNDRLDRFLSILTEVAYKHVPCKISSAGKPTTQIPRAKMDPNA